MKKTLAAAFAATLLMISGPAFAQGAVVSYEDLVSVLSGYHGAPDREYWAGLEPETARENLLRMIDDPEVFTVVRARAMTALTYFDGAEVERLLEGKMKTEKNPYLRASACEALVRAKGQRALQDLSEALSDEDVMVRLTAVRSLRKLGGPKAREIIREKMDSEKNDTARKVMMKTLEQIP
ncbi:MAG: HEAT repeat domain-containing protein [Candidatus Nitrospinota bacterium M3_3B_026]